MKHKHYDMIVAKAAIMDLVVFENDQHGKDDWYEIGVGKLPVNHRYSYFLCLPQHKEACLHWLNGGGVQDNFEGEWSDCPFLSQTINTGSENSLVFSFHHMFMNEEFHFRIAPKKEKRWIAVNSKTMKVAHDANASEIECEDALSRIGEIYEGHPWQFIEIEVEV